MTPSQAAASDTFFLFISYDLAWSARSGYDFAWSTRSGYDFAWSTRGGLYQLGLRGELIFTTGASYVPMRSQTLTAYTYISMIKEQHRKLCILTAL